MQLHDYEAWSEIEHDQADIVLYLKNAKSYLDNFTNSQKRICFNKWLQPTSLPASPNECETKKETWIELE